MLHIPVTLGAVGPAYHVDGVGSGVRFDGAVLGAIFAGLGRGPRDRPQCRQAGRLAGRPGRQRKRRRCRHACPVEGAIGYVELAYVPIQGLHNGAVQSRAGAFIQARPATVRRATGGIDYPADLQVSVTDGRPRAGPPRFLPAERP